MRNGFGLLTDALRYYFYVSNDYVYNKLRLVLFPFRHRDWARIVTVDHEGRAAYRPPQDDLNAPDLYIPLMAFVTWIILSSVARATQEFFSPEVFGKLASRGLSVVLLEVLVLKGGLHMLSDAPAPPMLTLVAWSGYKFVGACLVVMAFLVLGTLVGYSGLLYSAVASAFAINEQRRAVWLSAAERPLAGRLFCLGMMGAQLAWALVLSLSL